MDDVEDQIGGMGCREQAFAVDHYDWGSVDASTAVVETTVAASGTDATDLPPLYEAIDPDALDALIGGNGEERERHRVVEVWFDYAGYHVTVRGDGEVAVGSRTNADAID